MFGHLSLSWSAIFTYLHQGLTYIFIQIIVFMSAMLWMEEKSANSHHLLQKTSNNPSFIHPLFFNLQYLKNEINNLPFISAQIYLTITVFFFLVLAW